MGLTDNILDAVDILIEDKVSGLQFNKTIRGKIAEIIDASIGQYKIQYQNSYFTAYASDSNVRYSKNADVYVEILSNDFERNALILGTVQRLGSNYITIVEKLDKYTEIGNELISNEIIGLSSYRKDDENRINLYTYQGSNNQWTLDTTAINQAVQNADSIKIGMHIITNLAASQQTQGNYGLKIVATYYNEAQREDINNRGILDRLYIFDINDMIGQPYRYIGSGSDQYAIFPIDAKNFIRIKSITAFCEGFPQDESKKNIIDITLSDFSLQFLKELTEEELNSSFLSINALKGNYFTASDVTNNLSKDLVADLRIKGKKVNYNSQAVDFYWFRTNLSIHAGDEKFSPYGGLGWERLNATSLNVYKYPIKAKDCTGADTKFKCVAVFTESGQTTSVSSILHMKIINGTEYQIISSAGTNFSFNIGTTNLTISPHNNANWYYCWTRSLNGETPEYIGTILQKNNFTIPVSIANPATDFIVYECSIYNNNSATKQLLGTASITLINNKENLGCTLVINNGNQVFKYDTYGTSPASQAVAAADRMTIPILSFDIYDRQGNLIQIPDVEKSKYMKIRWIWPTNVEPDVQSQTVVKSHILNLTMLTCDYTLKSLNIPNIQTGELISYPGVEDQPTFTYGIRDMYQAELANTTAARNNIRLEVDYQGEHLVASTNFTFTKEGELGTNGTKYTARLVPVNGYNDLILFNSSPNIYGIKLATSTTATVTNIGSINTAKALTNFLTPELWDGTSKVTPNKVEWSLASTSARSNQTSRFIIDSKNGLIKYNTAGNSFGDIIKVTLTYDNKKFYATYPILYTTATGKPFPYIKNGYNEVMYESDGSRGRFLGLSFESCQLTANNTLISVNGTFSTSTISGFKTPQKDPKLINAYIIEPPSYFIGETAGHYIALAYGNRTTYRPIELYLNRYGMSAMNDWDGNSVQVDKDGQGYILAPQVGAGRKEDDNSFTGITIGEVFQNNNNKQIGMFGYYKGARSLFLDAETGDAEFGLTGKGQIKIHASDGEGTIDSGDYSTNAKTGLKIKFTSTGSGSEQGPYIKYGSGNFSVNSQGHLTAKGGGTIAGWQITNDYLRSVDKRTVLYAQNSPNMVLDSNSSDIAYRVNGEDITWKTERQVRFQMGNQFQINEDGAFKSTGGLIGGWRIGTNTLQSKDGKTTLYSTYYKNQDGSDNNNGLRLSIGEGKFAVYQDGRFKAANDKFIVAADGTIKATAGTIGGWSIGETSLWANNRNLVLLNTGDILGPDDSYYLGHNNDYSFSSNQYLNGEIKFYTDFDNTLRYTLIANNNKAVGSTHNLDKWIFYSGKNSHYYRIIAEPCRTVKENGKIVTYYRHKVTPIGTNFPTFTPHHRKWEITNKGVAYFTDVKIKNTNNAENSLSWTAQNGDNIFTLTDTGSKIGGWSISKEELSSGTVRINSQGNAFDGSIISVNDALKIYGSGTLSTTGALNALGGGNIGGASFSPGGNGAVSFPAGVMYFGGEVVTLNDTAFLTALDLRATARKQVGEVTGYVTLDGAIISGQDSQGGAIGGSVRVGGTISLSYDYYLYDFSSSQQTLTTIKALRTGTAISHTYPLPWNSSDL